MLPQYEVRQLIHTGQDGAQYLGRQSALERKVLIEILPELAESGVNTLMERLRIRARLVHPSLTAVFDFCHTSLGWLYLVSEHVEGTSLETLIEEHQLKPKTAFPWALQLCEALQIVHDQHLPHGSLSPQTVVITQEGKLKLTGIGMVPNAAGELSWLEPFQGSLSGDIHDLGVTLHWMFAKCPIGEDGRLSRDLPPAFATVLRRCLDNDPTRQFLRPGEVAIALKEALRGEQVKAETQTTRSRMVVAPGAKQPTGPAPVTTASSPSAKPVPPQLQPIVRQQQVSFFQRMDAFVWKAFSTGLHLFISLASVGCILLLILFKDKIVFEENTALPMASIEEIEADEKPIPAAVMGALPPAETLPTAPIAMKPITLVPPKPEPAPVDPLIDLRAQYVEAVQKAANQALEMVRYDDLPFLQTELILLQNGGDIPEVDPPNLPAILKALRQRYRETRAKMAP